MTIGIDCRLYSPKATGIGRYTAQLIEQLKKLDQKNNYLLYFKHPEFEAFECPNQRFQKKLADIPVYSFAEQTRWYFFLQKQQVDLMHFPHFNVPVLYRRPFVATIHDLTLHEFPHKSYTPQWSVKKILDILAYRFLMWNTVRHARHLIAVSQSTKNDLLKHYAINPENISVVHEGVPEEFQRAAPEKISEIVKKYGISKPYLLYAGVMRSHKNILNLMAAFDLMQQEPQDLQLVLVGKIDEAYPEINSRARHSGGAIVTTDFVPDEDLIALMSGASVFVFPSLAEGFGLPPLEAMRCGVPVACSTTTSLPEVCGEAAVYFDPKNPSDIAENVLKILKNDDFRKNLIQKGHENEKKFSWSRMAGQILDIYNKI